MGEVMKTQLLLGKNRVGMSGLVGRKEGRVGMGVRRRVVLLSVGGGGVAAAGGGGEEGGKVGCKWWSGLAE